MPPSAPVRDSALVSYGLIAGGVRVLVPAVFDLPFVRAVRGAMFDHLARTADVTLTAEARRILVDIEETATGRGVAEQAVRWIAGRFIPGAPVLDAVRNILRTYAAGVLFQRYLVAHRPATDPVLGGFEAERCRNALRKSVEIASIEHVRAMSRLAVAALREAPKSTELSLVQRYSDAVVTSIAELPTSWVEVLESDFARALGE